MWHCSAAPLSHWPIGRDTLRRYAYAALEGVGDATLGEWEEWTGFAFYVRRRLSEAEQESVGPAIDVRGTPEAARRISRVAKYAALSPQGREIMLMELGAPA